MKKSYFALLISFLIIIFALASCAVTTSTSDNSSTAKSSSSSATALPIAGAKAVYTGSGVTFTLINVPGKTFKTGTADGFTNTIYDPYWIAETETTYELWSAVYTWATDNARGTNKYAIAQPGQLGASGTGNTQLPVTAVSWRSAVVWCNALTEWYNAQTGANLSCVYYTDNDFTKPLRSCDTLDNGTIDNDPGHQDNPYVNWSASGFRLLLSSEWELAARYISDKNDDGDITDTGEYYPGNFLTGADARYDQTATVDYDSDGDIDSSTNVVATVLITTVKSKHKNALGIYDMNGNVSELCFDFTINNTHLTRGGDCMSSLINMIIGNEETVGINTRGIGNMMGFRIAKNQ